MSLLMLATGGGSPILPDPRPAPLDATVAAMRPNGRLLDTLEVSPDGTKDFTTISAALTQAALIQSTRMDAEGASTRTPNYRVDVIIHPGNYVENPVPADWVGLYGYGPDVVTVKQNLATNPQLGTVTPNGATYMEGITFIKDAEVSGPLPKYPIHNVNRRTSIFANVVFDNRYNNGTSYGSDGDNNGYTVLYKCTLAGSVNAHGWSHTLAGQDIAFINCTANSSVGWAALNDTAPDECWVVGGSVGSISVTGAATTLHRSGVTVAGSITAPIQDTRSDWPVPTGGLSAYDRAYYGM